MHLENMRFLPWPGEQEVEAESEQLELASKMLVLPRTSFLLVFEY
jgi:hypothetical protein